MAARVRSERTEREARTGARESVNSRSRREDTEDFDDVQDLERSLSIDEHALEVALADQPQIFYRVSKALALDISRRDAAKQALADAEARADLAVREEARNAEAQAARAALNRTTKDKAPAPKVKLTEGEVTARVQLDDGVLAARERFNVLNESVGKLSALKEAFQQRSYALKDLVGLYIANYYTASEHSGSSLAVKDRAAADARASMAEQRRRGG